jgi:hypothetical protein
MKERGIMNEKIGQTELHALQIATVRLEAATAQREAAQAREQTAAIAKELVHREVMKLYALQQGDSYDFATGQIKRAPRPCEPAPVDHDGPHAVSDVIEGP